MAWTVYILQGSDGSLYTGSTTDLPRRFAEHEAGRGARYTAARRPLRLLWAERAADRSAAQRREAFLKGLSRLEKFAVVLSSPLRLLDRFLAGGEERARFLPKRRIRR